MNIASIQKPGENPCFVGGAVRWEVRPELQQRHLVCRYRDLSYSIWGPFGFWATVLFQQIASIGNNITVQIAASISAKVRTYAILFVCVGAHGPGLAPGCLHAAGGVRDHNSVLHPPVHEGRQRGLIANSVCGLSPVYEVQHHTAPPKCITTICVLAKAGTMIPPLAMAHFTQENL